MKAELLNNPIDVSDGFRNSDHEYYVAHKVQGFDPERGEGKLQWFLHRYTMDWFFNKIDKHLQVQTEKGAPFQDYDLHPLFDFSISFLTERTLRIRMKSSYTSIQPSDSLMITNSEANPNLWKTDNQEEKVTYTSAAGTLELNTRHFSLKVRNKEGKLLTETLGIPDLKAMYSKYLPFCFMRNTQDYSRKIAATFSLHPDEKLYGCGESFTSLNKRGQKINLFTTDAQSTASGQMYKPVPFFFSSRGYGMFVHTSAPLTFDFGNTHQGATTLYSADSDLDLFIFLGSPAEILGEYTRLTGRSDLPPLWSFGLWMGCFSYRSQEEVMQVAEKMREQHYPCDVIHIDAGWFTKGVNCDFQFNKETFPDPARMMAQLREKKFRVSLWQIPYFTPNNTIYTEVCHKQLYIKDSKGNVPTEDAILDLSNEETKSWYREKLKYLLDLGASCIKADFGEAAPLSGFYASGKGGWYEHNLYPLRYNQLISDLTKETTGDSIIWARSAWAGSQRYPLHWGGDAEVSDAGMSGSLRGGLSLGLSGFSFWSHDIGGFSESPVEELFSRWSFFGLLSSHSRVHGFPPREPWHFSPTFQEHFRNISALRYRLIPYLYTQAKLCSDSGLPLMKALILNYPDDPNVAEIADQYLLGNDLLVAPVFEKDSNQRKVYLPEGKWMEYQTGEIYEGEKWYDLRALHLRGVLLLRCGALIPVTDKIESTQQLDWEKIQLIACTDGSDSVQGSLFNPMQQHLATYHAYKAGENWVFSEPNTEKKYPIVTLQQFIHS